MAKIQKPERKSRKGTPPAAPSANLDKPTADEKVQMKFEVSPEFRKEYKAYALDNDITMQTLLMKSFDLYKSGNF